MIEVVEEATPEVRAALDRLVPQLSRSAPTPSQDQIRLLLRSDAIRLLMARDENGHIVGTLTLAIFPIPTGVRAWIEDVIVDESVRGRGIGQELTEAALELARRAGARTVDLTSRPEREAANRLYLRMGFEERGTNVYRYALEPPSPGRVVLET